MKTNILTNRPKHRSIFIIALSLSAWLVQESYADMFKWVDDKGNVHYSDKQPESKAHNSRKITSEEPPGQIANRKANQKTAIALSHGNLSRHILIPEIQYSWKKPSSSQVGAKLGAYFVGQLCSPRGPIRNPEVYASHPSFFPGKLSLARSVNKVVKSLGYDSAAVLSQDLSTRLDPDTGVVINAEIDSIDIQTCAPLNNSRRYLDARDIGAYSFKKNRVKVSIRWQLKRGNDGEILIETQSDGYFDEWKSKNSVAATINKAVENATTSLMANELLVAQLSLTSAEYADMTRGKTRPGQEAQTPQNPLTNFIPFLRTGKGTNSIHRKIQANTILQSQLASVLAEISSVKVMLVQQYMQEGQWPLNKEAIGLNSSMFASHKQIADLKVRYDGSIHVDLRQDIFGDNKILQLTPNMDAYENGQSMNINWTCISNLDTAVLPKSCEAI